MTTQIKLTTDLVGLWTTTVRCRAERHRTVCTMWPDISSISFIVQCRAIGQRELKNPIFQNDNQPFWNIGKTFFNSYFVTRTSHFWDCLPHLWKSARQSFTAFMSQLPLAHDITAVEQRQACISGWGMPSQKWYGALAMIWISGYLTEHTTICLGNRSLSVKEYVASLIGLYRSNGAVSCVGNYFPFI